MLKEIRLYLKQSKGISRSLVWQLLAKWHARISKLQTIYKHEKGAALRAYLWADREYIRILKEIKTYKKNSIYDFGGLRMPACVITPDYYLNVFKPHMEHIRYDPESIRTFYDTQKILYPTVMYCKEIATRGESAYIGGHNVTHGFTYFYNEIVVKKDDVVFDLGSAPGDFAALASYYGAQKIYAFEPEESGKSDLLKLSKMNDGKIEIVRTYVGLTTDPIANMTSLDDFVKTHSVERVDFIKADIEGFEADMLRGATHILQTWKPKLVICTYHRENNPTEICDIIRAANDTYTIYNNDGVLYAF